MVFRSLTRQLLRQLLLYTLLFGMAVSALKALVIFQNGQDRMEAIPDTVAQLYLPLLAQSAWDVEIPAMQLQLKQIGQLPGVKSVALSTELGQTLRYDNPERKEDGVDRHFQLHVQSPSASGDIGTLTLDVSNLETYQTIRREVLLSMGEYLLALLGLAALIWLLFSRYVVTPLKRLAEALQRFKPGSPTPLPAPTLDEQAQGNELTQLQTAFVDMSDSINRYLQDKERVEKELASHRDQLARLVDNRTDELNQLLRFQQLVAATSTRFINIPLAGIDQATDMALEEVGHFMQVERCYLIGFDQSWRVNAVHEWCTHGVIHTTATMLGENFMARQWAFGQLKRYGLLSLDRLDELPEEAWLEQQELLEHRVQSLFMLRIDYMGKPVGLFGCDMVSRERHWQAKEQQQARLLGEMLANAIIRRQQLQELNLTQQKLKTANDDLARMAFSDGLTGIANRRLFDERLGDAHAEAMHSGQPLSVMQIDIDHFKLYNDTYGHLAGDECLRKVAQAIDQTLTGERDLAARVGGEEFAVLLPGQDAEHAGQVAERLQAAIRHLAIPHEKATGTRYVTISIGVAMLKAVQTTHQLMSDADRALYEAKSAGRNRVITAQ